MVKSPAELELLTGAARVSDLGMARRARRCRRRRARGRDGGGGRARDREAGAELSFTTVAGRPADGAGTFCRRTAMRRATPLCSSGARVHGYHGDMCHTVAVGVPSPELERALGAVAAAVEAGTAAARPGAVVADRARRPRRSRRRRTRRCVVGRVHAAWRRHRPARAAVRRPRPGVRALRGDGAVHRARLSSRGRPASSTSR